MLEVQTNFLILNFVKFTIFMIFLKNKEMMDQHFLMFKKNEKMFKPKLNSSLKVIFYKIRMRGNHPEKSRKSSEKNF